MFSHNCEIIGIKETWLNEKSDWGFKTPGVPGKDVQNEIGGVIGKGLRRLAEK